MPKTMSDAVIAVVGRRAFEIEVLESDLPVVVDFWAGFCTPCGKMSDTLAALVPLYADDFKFVKVDISDPANESLGRRFEITSIPLLLLFANGMRVDDVDLLGACSRKELVKWLDRISTRP